MTEGEQVRAEAGLAIGVGAAVTATAAASMHIWITWSQVAKTQAQRAAAARDTQHAVNGDPDTSKQSQAIGEEREAAIVAICAATFAAEAIVNALGAHVLPEETINKWKSQDGRPPKAHARLLETFKAAINGHALATSLADRWVSLIEDRNKAVHFYAEMQPLEMHPSGLTFTEAESVVYCQERAQEAVALLRGTLAAVRDTPRPKAARWGAQQSHLIDELDA